MSENTSVFITGASGFIAKHIVLQLLEGGYNVKGSVRSSARGDEVRATMEKHLGHEVSSDRLSFVNLDLNSDEGWNDALDGCDVLMHTASPFPISPPETEDELIRPAVDGTLRALNAAKNAGITRVILTSSCASIMNTVPPKGSAKCTEEDWSDVDNPDIRVYDKSKTLAERAAWKFVDENPEIQLTTINPSLVLGPGLDGKFGSSLELMQRILRGKDPAMPQLSFPIVDVRDIAKMHIRAMERPESIGRRFIGSDSSLWFAEVAQVMKDTFPDRKISARQAPNWLVKILAIFDADIRGAIPNLGVEFLLDNSTAKSVLEMDFIPAQQSISDSGDFLVENGYD